MPVINRVAAMQDEIAQWRRDIHENPEILYEVHRTAGVVADKLEAFGCDEVVPGIGKTGVVGVIKGRKGSVRQGDRHARRHGRAADDGSDRAALCLQDAGQDARLRARRAHGHAARRRQVPVRDAQLRRHGHRHLPAGRGGRRRRQGHGRRRDDGALEHPGGVRHAQHAGDSGRPVRHPPGSAAGRQRRHLHRCHGQGRPRRAAARVHRYGARRLLHRHGAAVDRGAQRRPAEVGRRLDLRVPIRRGAQRHPPDGAPGGHRPHAGPGGARPPGAARGRGGRGHRAAARRHRQGALRARAIP